MRTSWSGALTALVVWGCGADETLTPPPRPTPSVSDTRSTDGGLLDLCGAMWGLLAAPGMAERLCALQVTDPDDVAVSQCKLCASGLEFAERILPEPACYSSVEECPVSDAELRACFEIIGETLTDFVPNCDLDTLDPIDTTQVALRVATSSCGPVMLECKPLQELVTSLLAGQ